MSRCTATQWCDGGGVHSTQCSKDNPWLRPIDLFFGSPMWSSILDNIKRSLRDSFLRKLSGRVRKRIYPFLVRTVAWSLLTWQFYQHCWVFVLLSNYHSFLLSWIDNVKLIRSDRQMTLNLVDHAVSCPSTCWVLELYMWVNSLPHWHWVQSRQLFFLYEKLLLGNLYWL